MTGHVVKLKTILLLEDTTEEARQGLTVPMTLNHAQCTMTKITGAGLVPTHTIIGDTSLEDSKEASLGNSDCTTSPYDVTNTHVELVQPRSATSFYRFGSFFCSFVLLSFFAHCDISLFGTIHVNWFNLFVLWRS
jgi:hypothetical protein